MTTILLFFFWPASGDTTSGVAPWAVIHEFDVEMEPRPSVS